MQRFSHLKNKLYYKPCWLCLAKFSEEFSMRQHVETPCWSKINWNYVKSMYARNSSFSLVDNKIRLQMGLTQWYTYTRKEGRSASQAEIKLDIGIGALLRARIWQTRYRGLVVRRGRVRIVPWSLERTRRGWIRSRGGHTRRDGALLRKMTCHSRHVPSSPPSCSAVELSVFSFTFYRVLFFFIFLLRSRPLYLSSFYSNPRVI